MRDAACPLIAALRLGEEVVILAASYNLWVVAVSVVVAILASYTALDMAARIVATQGRSARLWLAGGSTAMGCGIWSMHFIGMLALRLPIPIGYDPWLTGVSLLIGVASSAFALWLVCQRQLSLTRLAVGSMLMGAGMSAMYAIGIAAMRIIPPVRYQTSLLLSSIAIAIAASGTALWLAFRLRTQAHRVRLLRAGAAVVMGLAIAGMHYTAMAAARFSIASTSRAVYTGISATWLALLIGIAAFAGLSIALIISVLDMRLESRTAQLAASLARANHELTYLALHDNLTKLPNRALFEDRLGHAIEQARRESRPFALMFLDLDGFKAVNDAFGHHTGDLLLEEVALRIRAEIRGSDTLARLGGDEFALLAEMGEEAAAAALADKLVRTVAMPYRVADHDLRISVSIGIVLYEDSSQQQHDLLRSADAAMYHAKASGRNGYCFFQTAMQAHAQEQLELLQDLRSALERREMMLHYQPKFDAASTAMVGVEALLRWQHPVRGLIPPDQFIPLAEKTGLIVPIGAWALDEACRQMGEWRAAGYTAWTVAVNLSSLQFSHAGLTQLVRETLERHSLEPGCLTLEVTETTAMQDPDTSMAILERLSEMGVHISIDDFGTGYSSLLYLKRLPATELKIDRGFVRDLTPDSEDAAIVSAIVALGRTLNLKVVAEGIETPAQEEFLTRIGCSSLQGFLLGRPMTAEQLVKISDNAASRQSQSSIRHRNAYATPILSAQAI